MILPGIGSMVGLGKSAPTVRGDVQSAINSDWENGDWSPDIVAHEAGDVLVVIIASYRSSGEPDIDVSSGWTTLEAASNPSGLYSAVLRRTAVNDATTLTLTNNNTTSGDQPSNIGIVHSFACIDAYGSVDQSRSVSSRNPPSLSPSWGAENSLWIAASICNGTAPATQPSGFLNPVQSSSGTIHLSTAQLEADVPTLDPGAFEGTGATGDLNHTIAVRPE